MFLYNSFVFEITCNLRKGVMPSRVMVNFNMEKFWEMFIHNHIPFVSLLLSIKNSAAKDIVVALILHLHPFSIIQFYHTALLTSFFFFF